MFSRVEVTIKGGSSSPEVKTMPLHKKNPDVGTKKTVYADSILIEKEDAKSFAQNEEVGERVGNAEGGGT